MALSKSLRPEPVGSVGIRPLVTSGIGVTFAPGLLPPLIGGTLNPSPFGFLPPCRSVPASDPSLTPAARPGITVLHCPRRLQPEAAKTKMRITGRSRNRTITF